ncbi:MAG: hypothetical protein OXG35_11035 [Acidobacteria bacterium]|nr:hypothetical protein [Acidobacteriota bacterium]
MLVPVLPTAALGRVDHGLPGRGWDTSLSTGRMVVLGSVVELPPLDSPGVIAAKPQCRPRPRLLTPMLVAYTGLQLADAHSILRSVAAGAVEVNPSPVAQWAARSPARAYAVKAGVVAGTWWGAEFIACRYPRPALWLVVALNGFTAVVVTHNYRVGSSLLAAR